MLNPASSDVTRFLKPPSVPSYFMPLRTTTTAQLRLQQKNLEVTIASTFAEIDAALRLRFEVFNLELREGLSQSYERGFDRDAYDAWCDHLIVKDLTSDAIIGTYRLLRGSIASRNTGFYSENEFDLRALQQLPGEALELGRSCVARSHRSFATINLLWQAITQYVQAYNCAYLFGCASLHTASAAEVAPLYAYLREHHYAPANYRVMPVEACRMPLVERLADDPPAYDERAVRRALPPILKGYLRAGAMVCGPPAFDADFGTTDLFVLLKTESMATRYQHHYSEACH